MQASDEARKNTLFITFIVFMIVVLTGLGAEAKVSKKSKARSKQKISKRIAKPAAPVLSASQKAIASIESDAGVRLPESYTRTQIVDMPVRRTPATQVAAPKTIKVNFTKTDTEVASHLPKKLINPSERSSTVSTKVVVVER